MTKTMKHAQLKIAGLLVISLFIQSAIAEDYLSPEVIIGSTKINAEMLIQLARHNEDLVIIDSRIKADRRQGFIAGSISLPDTETNCTTLLPIIDRRDTPTVFYCNGPKCRRSDIAVDIAKECKYTNIYWFRGGFEEWKNKEYLISK